MSDNEKNEFLVRNEQLMSVEGLDPFRLGGHFLRKAMFVGGTHDEDEKLKETIRVFRWQELRDHSEVIRAASMITEAIEHMARLGLASAVQVALEGEFGDTLLLDYSSDVDVRQQVYRAVKAYVVTTQISAPKAAGIIEAMKKTHREDLQKKREFYRNGPTKILNEGTHDMRERSYQRIGPTSPGPYVNSEK